MRLTVAIRKSISKAVMNYWETNNPQPTPTPEEAEAKFALWVWQQRFGEYEGLLARIPSDFLHQNYTVKVAVGPVDVLVLNLGKKLPSMWSSNYGMPPFISIPEDQPEYLAYRTSKDAYTDWHKRRNDARSQAQSVLGAYTTLNKLMEGWPEVVNLIPEDIKAGLVKPGLPSLPMEAINTKLGLPVAAQGTTA